MLKIKRIFPIILCMTILAGCTMTNGNSMMQQPDSDPAVAFQPESSEDIVYPSSIPENTAGTPAAQGTTGITEVNEGIVENVSRTGGFAVSSSSSQATWVGMNVLADGGNAVDAAVAMSFTLGVVEPNSSGLGGSGMMLIYDPATDSSYFLDYYGSAGASAYMSDEVAIPGLLKGMETALDCWGTISLSDALQPAIDYAEQGFTASDYFMGRLDYSTSLAGNPAFADISEGDTVIQSELADTLKLIQSEGTDVFYSGQIAADIAANCGLTVSDLTNYEVYCTEPLESTFQGYRILSGNAPSSGVTVAQMLGIAEQLEMPSAATDFSGYLSALKQSTLLAYSQRRSILVDPRFYDFDGSTYVSESYIASILDTELTSAADDEEMYCTTQFSVIDGNGMIVCVTNTLSDNWGSYTLVDGFYLNNSLSNFGTTGVNAYEPNKRPRTHFAPVIALGDDGYCLAVGSPGGSNIPRIVVQVLVDILQNGTDVQTAVDRIRVMYDSDGVLCIETNDDGRDSFVNTAAISDNFYYSSSHLYFGCTSIVGYQPGEGVFAASDRRRSTSQAMYYFYEDK